MQGQRLYRRLRKRYIERFEEHSSKCSRLFALYSTAYHKFVMLRDLHVHLAGAQTFSAGSAFSETEFKAYRKAMDLGRTYVKYCIDNFDSELLVPCVGDQIEDMNRARIYSEFICELHPTMQHFVRIVDKGSLFQVDFIVDLFGDTRERNEYERKFKMFLYSYYPVYTLFPTIYNGVQSLNIQAGSLDGSLVMSHAEHVGITKMGLEVTTTLCNSTIEVILRYMFQNFGFM